ncbi:MAG: serine/threonine protein kinase [Planctomycetes bacterium]|nr:serine/threonine protein kinase [Planctomycetota bacterium]
MSADRDQLIKRLFVEAGERTGDERERFLDEGCGNDAPLRQAVVRLLAADAAAATGFLDGPPAARAPAEPSAQIGRFRLVRKIGEGGMGAVFEAEQIHPRRRVALKMVRHAGLSESLRRRFEYEVQILGQLRHPGIAQIYEAATHDDPAVPGGPIPYFAMEYVQGRSLLDFASHGRLTARQRLALMSKICDAVHHAHQKGVIHRDLKPANILVEPADDGHAQPKILDFGVARATRSDVQMMTMHTEVGQIIGTLSYMSPEQVAGRPDEIDLRSDVYSLGVMLYELLTGRLPYDLRDRSLSEAGNLIREQEPTRLGSVDAALRGDVETIVAKALAKERERRYQSAAELGDDILRFLNDEPIVARPATRAYQLRKFAKRNKGLVGGIVAAFAILLLAVAGISVALIKARRAEHAALQSAATATAVSSFLRNMLAGVDPEDIGPRALTVREVLDHAAARLQRELVDQPEVAASVHQTLGNHYGTLGHYVEADRHLRQAVELRRSLTVGDDPNLADALTDLAANLEEKRDLAGAEGPLREALDMRRRLFGQDSLEVAETLHGLGSILIDQGRARDAEPLVRESLEIRRRLLGAQHADVATSTGTLGWCLMALDRLDVAETAVRDAVEMVRRLPGDNERALAARLTFLSGVLRARGKYVEEEAVVREAVDIRSRRLTADHPSLAWNLFCLAKVRWRLGDLSEAETNCRKALEIYTAKRGPRHSDIADCQQLLAQIHDDQGRWVEAESWWIACLEMRRNLLPADDPEITFAEEALARNRAAQRSASVPPGATEAP